MVLIGRSPRQLADRGTGPTLGALDFEPAPHLVVLSALKTELENNSAGVLPMSRILPCRPVVVISGLGRLTVAVLAWGRTAAWKGMLNAVLMDDQRAKKKAGLSCQFGYQLADGTTQKLRNLAPVHSVRDRGVGGSNPLAPTTKNGRKSDEKALQFGGLF
jgi:hypothetical protein